MDDMSISEVTDLSGSKFYTCIFIILVLIGITIILILNQASSFDNCKNKEHATCPVFNCAVSDQIGTDYCSNNAMRFDESGKKICSGSISS